MQTPMANSSILVVRGSYRGTDPTYACASHNMSARNYAVIHVDGDGLVTGRTIVPFSERHALEKDMRTTFRGSTVMVDMRESKDLLPLKAPESAQSLDFESVFRGKSSDELNALQDLSGSTRQVLEAMETGENTFRGAAEVQQNQYASHTKHAKGFTEYRGGFKDSLGRCSDLTHVVPHNSEWEQRMERVHRGLDAVQENLYAGADVSDLNSIFMEHVDEDKDVIYGDVVHHTGFKSHEDYSLKTVKDGDFLTLGVMVEGGGERAIMYRSGHAIQGGPEEPKVHSDPPIPRPLCQLELLFGS